MSGMEITKVQSFKMAYTKRNNDQKIFQGDCPFGCPCDKFDCQPDKKNVLVLNSSRSSNKQPVLIKFDGEFD